MGVRIERIPIILLAMFSLIVGLIAGLHRMGWNFAFAISADHGGIMIGGFLGTLISFEKVIPLKKKLLFTIPVLSGASVVFFFIGLPAASMTVLTLASTGLFSVFLFYLSRQHNRSYVIMSLGAFSWLVGNIAFLLTGFYRVALPWWMAFTLLIIAAERLELMQFLPVTIHQKRILTGILGVFILSCLFTFHGAGGILAAAALISVAIWLLRYDVVAIHLRKRGLIQYIGVALLSGYFALMLTGIFIPLVATQPMGYDAVVHAYFIGFVFSMIFAHGPMILPGILGISEKPFHPLYYLWLFMLHSSWMIRVLSDLSLDLTLRKYSGVLTAISILGYFLTLSITTIRRYRAHAL